MRVIIFVSTLILASSVFAAPPSIRGPVMAPADTSRAMSNSFGGYTFYGNRGYNGRSQPNSFGGYNTYDRYGYLSQQSYKSYTGSYRIQNFQGRR